MGRRVIILIAAILALFASAQTKGQQPSVYKVERIPVSTDVFSEISPVPVKTGLIFCSDKRFSIIKDRISFDGRRLYNLYLAERVDSSKWKKPVELTSERNTLFNTGPFTIAPDGKTVYFTSEIETGLPARQKNFKNHSGIFIADLIGTSLGAAKPFKYNSPDYDIAQPFISEDGKFLFFASNMPGGFGGSDIYYCENEGGEWAPPVNIGPAVNSAGAENYPCMHPSGKLFFTSDRSGGIGKLDIYSSIKVNGQWEAPALLPEPINSPADDFGLVPADDLHKGYFSTNRNSSDDIYSFVSTIIRKGTCNNMEENSYCYQFVEENSVKFDSLPFRYEWRFGDGQKAEGIIVQHCYDKPGTYIVQLDVINLVTNEVLENEKSDTLVVTKIEQAFISGPDSITAGERINLNADETYLPGWNIAQYYWNFGDETVAIGNNVDKIFIKPGEYNVQLIVSSLPVPGTGVKETCVSKNIKVISKP